MASTPWYTRLFRGTRGQLIAALRGNARTVDELASALDLTDNAVRAHLAALERDGLVRQSGVRRGAVGKPAYAYELTAEAEELVPKAYGPVLDRLLDVLDERMASQEIAALLREVGRRLSAGAAVPASNLGARLDSAVGLLNELGGMAEREEHDGTYAIRCSSCPMASLAPRHPEVCQLGEALLTEVIGRPVHEHCARGTPPRCLFEVEPSDPPTQS